MNVIEIPLSQIEVGDRLRTVDPSWVEFLAASIADRGQDTPIWVRKSGRGDKYFLIAGGHRLAALKLAGKEAAFATLHKVSATEAELLEIDENLIRRELTPLDRATFLAQRKAVYEKLHPETKQGGDRKSDQSAELCGLIPAFSEATAEKLGLSRRTIETAVQLHGLIVEDVRQIENLPKPPAPEKLEKFHTDCPAVPNRLSRFTRLCPYRRPGPGLQSHRRPDEATCPEPQSHAGRPGL